MFCCIFYAVKKKNLWKHLRIFGTFELQLNPQLGKFNFEAKIHAKINLGSFGLHLSNQVIWRNCRPNLV